MRRVLGVLPRRRLLGIHQGVEGERLYRGLPLAAASRMASNASAVGPFFKVIPLAKLEDASDREEALARSEMASRAHRELEQACAQGGGPRGIKRHVVTNKKTLVRDRIRAVLDPDEPEGLELCTTAGMGLEYGDVPGAGTVTLVGRIAGVRCALICNDATVKGGTSYPITVAKSLRMQEVAAANRLPCLYMVDSGGAFLFLQSDIFPDAKHGGRTFAEQARMSAAGIPQVSLVNGLCTAGGAYTPTMAEEHVMVHKIANVYLGGPPLVKAALGENVSGEDLGGATLHCRVSGVADHFAATEEESFRIVRDIFASLNLENQGDEGSDVGELDPPLAPAEELAYFAGLAGPLSRGQVLQVLARFLDGSRFAEFKSGFGPGLVCGFGRVRGRVVGLVANCELADGEGPLPAAPPDPGVIHGPAGAPGVGWREGQKGAHFVQICDSRDIPMLFLQNGGRGPAKSPEPIGGDCLSDGVALKERAKLASCIATARVPKITLNLTGAFGDHHLYLCGPGFGPRFYFCWPRAKFRGLHLGFGEKEDVGACGDDLKDSEECLRMEGSAQYAASRCLVDGIILPSDTRRVLSEAFSIVMENYVANRTLAGINQALSGTSSSNFGPIRM